MQARLLFAAAIAVLSTAVLMNVPLSATRVDAAPQISEVAASTTMNPNYTPSGIIGIEFSGDNKGVFVTFAYSDLPAGARLSRIVRFNGDDINWDGDTYGRLQCCASGGTGRYGFQVIRLNGSPGDLPGGAYDVRIYVNGVETGSIGFGVKGTGGRSSNIPGRPNLHKDNDNN